MVWVFDRALMHNEEEFPEPMEFKPERFLNPDGSLNDQIRDPATAVFGFGKRRVLLACTTVRTYKGIFLAILSDSARLSGSRGNLMTMENQLSRSLIISLDLAGSQLLSKRQSKYAPKSSRILFEALRDKVYNCKDCKLYNKENHLRDKIAQELGGSTQMSDKDWVASLYKDLATKDSIEQYLSASGHYRDGRWVGVPETGNLKSDLHEPLCKLINSIIQYFGGSQACKEREALVTGTTQFKHEAPGSPEQPFSPGIVIRASGSSFYTTEKSSLEFSNIAACFVVKLDADANELELLNEMTSFAKQTFIRQPNRFFVRSLAVTEQRMRLFHFDRSGAQYTPFFNIHSDPHTFIRLILGLSSTEERNLGFDDTIQWTTGSDGKRTGGTLTTIGPDNTSTTYYLTVDEDPFVRANLRGRGTTCWAVKNSRGERFIIKDYWLAGNRVAEFNLLTEAKDLPGVCQMVSYEDNRAQTKDFRGNISGFTSGAFHNRTAIRIVMKAYGPSVENFTSVMEVLAALRDAIAGHRALLGKNIIHCDVSLNNILLGESDAPEGEQGVLIDLDIACRCDAPFLELRANFTTGTRMFQSLMVLQTCELPEDDISAHDYLDDLESFFWVFSYILLMYKANGELAVEGLLQEGVRRWNRAATFAHDTKSAFLNCPATSYDVAREMDEGWRHACIELFSKFKDYMSNLATEKRRLLFEHMGTEAEGEHPNRFSSLLEHVDEHYDYILGLFDDALKKAKEASRPIPVSTPSTPTLQAISSGVASPAAPGPVAATVPDLVLPNPPQTSSPPSLSDPSNSTLCSDPPESSSQVQLLTVSRILKRRFEDAELDAYPTDSKRACPPSRRPLKLVMDPASHIINSLYEFCIRWL
ncbi:hypothetical protein EST38_g13062 [Candolleomyces aberdarensis]|uniref:Fungal-type protein kinase domain-containing protein n=1 Tax=Candolleomyces aberdarensis TaxID=2316362 RepID=A0A4Q2D368_9AGAR|nr:hypothetical protein EST38_g13062 [Candolleomyces aberdarensis]